MEWAVAVLGAFVVKVPLYDIPAALIEAAQTLIETAQNLIRDLLRALGIDDGEPLVLEDFGYAFFVGEFEAFEESGESTRAPLLSARQFTPRIDPLALDLDGDGLETVGITTTAQVLFDHDGDGIRTGTGWLKGDDAFLALDKNGNGTIDNGNELFGVDTVLSNGQKATSGFAALADLDSNHDGQFSSLDAQFANVRLWRDLNQDGISTADELQTLADAGIASISLSSTATNIPLTGGNVQSAAGTYTRTNGTTGALGEFTTGNTGNLDLAQNPFYREFVDSVPLTAGRPCALPDMQGAGAVRDLQEAASLNATLVSDVNNLATLSRTEMLGQIDQLLKDWSATSALKTSQQRAADKGIKLLYKIPGVTDAELEAVQLASTPGYDKALILATLQVSAARYDVVKAQVDQFSQMMDILERFNGQTFLNFPTDGSIHMGNGTLVQTQIKSLVPTPGGVSTTFSFALPTLTATHVQLLQDSYNALKQSVYDGLVMSTRLKGYLDAVSLVVDENGIQLDLSAMTTQLNNLRQTDPVRAFTRLSGPEAIRYRLDRRRLGCGRTTGEHGD